LSVGPSPGQCLSTSTPGARCDFLCFGNLYCDGSETCRELPGLGQTCSAFVPCRGFDLACTGGQCAPRSDVGAGCATSDTCRPGLFCTSELGEAKPVCAAPRRADQPCTDPSHCQSYQCSGNAAQPGTCLAWSDRCPAGHEPARAAGR
jgi:hypothetical protein